ncbi:MAG: 1-deoxy-D-xylulose-5-phosphate synthase [Bacilli bacterium]|nr:1-deoxy-D-xylulose-5-phosphate synthase [Bacilli bacterium]
MLDNKDVLNKIKDMTVEELSLLASECRERILAAVSTNGGHLSSNLGVVEATISLLRNFNIPQDKIIFDVGHQSYTYKLLTGRSLERLRCKDGVGGFPSIDESSYDCYGTGHSSTSISAAYGFALAKTINNKTYNVISFIGDASLVNGLSFEGLNLLGKSNHKVIIVLNDNDMAISKPVGIVSDVLKEPAGVKLFKDLGYEIYGPVDGHDFVQLDEAFSYAKISNKSIVIHLKTKKGYGYTPAERDVVGDWHGVPPFDVRTGTFLRESNSLSWSSIYSEILLKNMKLNNKIVSIVPATGYGSNLKPIFDYFPSRSIDVGIAEEHAVTMAASLSLEGLRPVISIYSTFLQRTYDQILHELARQKCGVTFLIDRAGIVGGDGETHQGIYDESFLLGIPGTIVAMASSKLMAEELFIESLRIDSPFFIRYPKENNFIIEGPQTKTKFGKWIKEIDNNNAKVILTFGPIINEIKEKIAKQNLPFDLINAVYQKPLDIECLKDISKKYKKVIIYNRYATENGFSRDVIYELSKLNFKDEIKDFSLPNIFIKHGSIEETIKELRLTISDILD